MGQITATRNLVATKVVRHAGQWMIMSWWKHFPLIGHLCAKSTSDWWIFPQKGLLCGDFMMTSSNGNIFRVTGPLCREFTCPGEFPAQRPVTRSFDVFFDLRLNKRLCKQPWGWWFERLSRPLWRHCNVMICVCLNMLLRKLSIFEWFETPWPLIWHHCSVLWHCGLTQIMAAILQTTFWCACILMQIFIFFFKFHRNLLPEIQLTIQPALVQVTAEGYSYSHLHISMS